ncbi:MAG TPA: hypothetical protein VHG72_10555 [Polyangia bacterium]|nr:hypothetical protein [Polyangia bacterium]
MGVESEAAALNPVAEPAALPARVIEAVSSAAGRSEPRLPATTIALAVVLDLAAAWLFVVGPHTWFAYGLTVGLHLMAVVPLVLVRRLPPSQRGLLIGFGLALPLVGAPIVAAALTAKGKPAVLEDVAGDEYTTEPLDPAAIRRFAEALPAAEVLLTGTVEDRRALLSMLGQRADKEAVAMLRWALTATPPDIGMEAALALDDMSTTFEKRLVAARKQVEETPTGAAALAAADLIMGAVQSQMLDAYRVGTLASEARRHFSTAHGLDMSLAADVALGLARLELALLRPDAALEVLEQALPSASPEARPPLESLRQEALLSAHDLPWEGQSLLNTYRRPLPPPLPRPHRGRTRMPLSRRLPRPMPRACRKRERLA